MRVRSEESEIRIDRERDAVTVRVSGAVDITTADALLERLHEAALIDAERVVIDLGRVSFMDSTGLHALLKAYQRFGERLRIVSTSALEPLFEHAGARRFLPFVD
jgi:anti-anti-sigma factor